MQQNNKHGNSLGKRLEIIKYNKIKYQFLLNPNDESIILHFTATDFIYYFITRCRPFTVPSPPPTTTSS